MASFLEEALDIGSFGLLYDADEADARRARRRRRARGASNALALAAIGGVAAIGTYINSGGLQKTIQTIAQARKEEQERIAKLKSQNCYGGYPPEPWRLMKPSQIIDRYWSRGKLPINPFVIALAMDIEVRSFECPQDQDIQGRYVPRGAEGNTRAIVEYNRNAPIMRQRFILAHELGHLTQCHQYLNDPLPQDLQKTYKCYNKDNLQDILDEQERRYQAQRRDEIQEVKSQGYLTCLKNYILKRQSQIPK